MSWLSYGGDRRSSCESRASLKKTKKTKQKMLRVHLALLDNNLCGSACACETRRKVVPICPRRKLSLYLLARLGYLKKTRHNANWKRAEANPRLTCTICCHVKLSPVLLTANLPPLISFGFLILSHSFFFFLPPLPQHLSSTSPFTSLIPQHPAFREKVVLKKNALKKIHKT